MIANNDLALLKPGRSSGVEVQCGRIFDISRHTSQRAAGAWYTLLKNGKTGTPCWRTHCCQHHCEDN
jgi:hypothetical protein